MDADLFSVEQGEALQHQIRAFKGLCDRHKTWEASVLPVLVQQFEDTHRTKGDEGVVELVSAKLCIRSRKQRREVKAWEREWSKKRAELELAIERRRSSYLDAILSHRDEFVTFHRDKRLECKKVAASVKSHVEGVDMRRQKEFLQLEARRLEALRENDMDAYMALVAETKNDRLHFLLSETDQCLATINKLVAQHSEDTSTERRNEEEKNTILAAEQQDAGQIKETFTQPKMLQGGYLKDYQLHGLRWLASLHENNLNGILADEMGLGKTIQALALLAHLVEEKGINGPFLITVPLSTLSNWANEAAKWTPGLTRVIYKGTNAARKQIFKEEVASLQFNVLITTHEFVLKDKSSLRKVAWEYIIVDEGHRVKNAQSKLAQTLGTVYESRRRLLLTGTPLQNNLQELWSLLNFLLPSVFNSLDSFDSWFNKPFTAFRTQSSSDNEQESDFESGFLSQEERLLIVHRLHEVLRPFMLRRVKQQVLQQLPEKVERVLRCNLSGWQRKIYRAIDSKGTSSGGEGLNNPQMHLRKVCNHPYLFLTEWNIDEDLIRVSGKFELLDRILPKLKAGGHRVLLFTQMTQLMTIFEQFLNLRGMKHLRLDGSTSADDREKRVALFNQQESDCFVFLLSTRAGGLGINLASADTVILFDSDWNPTMDQQAQDRAHRIGQTKVVKVFRLVTTTSVEDRILEKATDKRKLNGLAVEAGALDGSASSAAGGGNKEMMETLLKEWSSTGGSAADDEDSLSEDGASEVPDDEQINEMLAGGNEGPEFELYQRMDSERQEIRQAQWTLAHHSRGVSLDQIPDLPATALMGRDEQPSWLTSDIWQNRKSDLVQYIMKTKNSAEQVGAEGGRGKRRRTAKSFAEEKDEEED